MIYIWHNGGQYSDSATEIIQTDLPQEEVTRFLEAGLGGTVLGWTEHMDFREGGAAAKLHEVAALSPYDFVESYNRERCWENASPAVLQEILAGFWSTAWAEHDDFGYFRRFREECERRGIRPK